MKLLTRIGRWLNRRSFEAAGVSGRWPTGSMLPYPAYQASAARWLIAPRAAWLAENAPIAASIANLYSVSLIGDGCSTRSAHPNKAMAQALEDRWNEFSANADLEGGGADLVSVLNRIARAFPSQGEAFVRYVIDGGELRVQVLQPTQIDSLSRYDLDGGGWIESGIEFDARGRRIAYHVRPAHNIALATTAPIRVPADDMAHIFEARLAGQTRGLPWISPAATSILELDSLQDALLAKAKVSALHCGFIRDLDGTSGAAFGDGGDLSMEPGTVRVLPAGADVSFPPTSDFNGVQAFLTHQLRMIAAAVGAPYELVAGDLSNTNYSSAKLGREAFERRCKAIRASVIEARFLRPLWARFVATEILSGRINAPAYARDTRPFNAVTFMWPQFGSLEPYKEAQAATILLQTGLASRQELIEARGRDFADVDREINDDAFEQPELSNVRPLTGQEPAAA